MWRDFDESLRVAEMISTRIAIARSNNKLRFPNIYGCNIESSGEWWDNFHSLWHVAIESDFAETGENPDFHTPFSKWNNDHRKLEKYKKLIFAKRIMSFLPII